MDLHKVPIGHIEQTPEYERILESGSTEIYVAVDGSSGRNYSC